jgi:glycosyltransferase involved in cell wall biosynthesis
MRILHLIDSGGLYGAEMMLLELMRQQHELGHEPLLASIGAPGAGEKAIELEALRRGLKLAVFRMANGPNFPGALRVLLHARKQAVDLLHSHGYKGNILFGLLPWRLRDLPMVTTLHGYTSNGRFGKMMLYEALDRFCLRRIDRVVLVSPRMQHIPALARLHNTTVIENGIAFDGVFPTPDPDLVAFMQRKKTVVAVGRLSPEKGFDLLLQAVANLVKDGHDLQVLLLGEGGLRASLENLGQRLGLAERLLMPGYITGASAYLEDACLLAIPSLTEGLPITLLEAMVAAVPIVASAVGGIPEALDHGQAGYLVPAGDSLLLQKAMSQVLADPLAVRKRCKRAQERVRLFYSSQTMAKNYLAVYATAIQKAADRLAGQKVVQV